MVDADDEGVTQKKGDEAEKGVREEGPSDVGGRLKEGADAAREGSQDCAADGMGACKLEK